MKWFHTIRLFGAAFLLGGALYAQPNVPWWENPVGEGLNLTDSQRERINGIARDFRDRLMQKRQEANRAEQDLEDVFNAEVVDSQRGRNAIERLARIRADLTRDVSQMTLQMRTVLTAEQWRALQSRRDAAGPPASVQGKPATTGTTQPLPSR